MTRSLLLLYRVEKCENQRYANQSVYSAWLNFRVTGFDSWFCSYSDFPSIRQ